MVAALHMLMGEDRASDDRNIGIRADKIVREEPDEVKSLFHKSAVDLHRRMFPGKNYAMFIVVRIRGIL